MRMTGWMVSVAVLAAVNSPFTVRSHADLFKLDFGDNQNAADGVTLTDWNVIGTWLFTDFPNGKAV